jgi:hypothetical protein
MLHRLMEQRFENPQLAPNSALVSRRRPLGLVGLPQNTLQFEDHVLAGAGQDQPFPRRPTAFFALQNFGAMPRRDDLHRSNPFVASCIFLVVSALVGQLASFGLPKATDQQGAGSAQALESRDNDR